MQIHALQILKMQIHLDVDTRTVDTEDVDTCNVGTEDVDASRC